MKITGYTSKTLKMAFAVLLVVVACGIAFMACRGGRDPGDGRNYRDLISKPVKELVDSGRALMFAGKNDSAYILYLAAINLYSDKMSEEEKKLCELACNNAGHISSCYFHNYPQAYSHLLKALEIAEQIDYRYAYPYIHANLGNLLCYTGRWEEGMAHQVKSIEAACAMGDTAMYLGGIANLAIESMLMGKAGEYKKTLNEFPRIKGEGDLFENARLLCTAARHQMAGEWSLAGGCFRNLARYDSCGIADPERLVFFRQYLLARQEKRLGNTRRALAILDSIARQPLNSPELKCYLYEDLADLNKKAGNLAPAAEWKLKFVDIKDSLISDNKQRTIYNLQRRFDEREINYRMELLLQERRNLVRTIWIVSVFSAVVVILLVAAFILRRNTIRAERNVFAANQQILKEEDLAREEHNDEELRGDIELVRSFFEKSEEIYTPDFNIEKMAASLGIPARRVSKAINKGLSQNFSTALQTFRIREACRRLSPKSEGFSNYTIEAVAESVGFRSRSNFHSIFKKITGLTPSQYQKLARKENV